jgi:integrase
LHCPAAQAYHFILSRKFPSAKLTTPLGRDNAWRGLIAPRLKTVQLEWATFQIMRRTHASLSRQAGIDPKLVADQLGHGLGVRIPRWQ